VAGGVFDIGFGAAGSEEGFYDAWEVAFGMAFFDEAVVEGVAEGRGVEAGIANLNGVAAGDE